MSRPLRQALVRRLLALYTRIPEAPESPRASDYRIVNAILDRGVEAEIVEYALHLGLARRRLNGELPHTAISTFAYFLPIIDEILADDTHRNPSYQRYVLSRALPRLRPESPPKSRRNRPEQLKLPF